EVLGDLGDRGLLVAIQSHTDTSWQLFRVGLWHGVYPSRLTYEQARSDVTKPCNSPLVPIEESVVDRVINRGRGDSWRLRREAFQAEGDYLERRADKLRAEIGRSDLSTLRDVDGMLCTGGVDNALARAVRLTASI